MELKDKREEKAGINDDGSIKRKFDWKKITDSRVFYFFKKNLRTFIILIILIFAGITAYQTYTAVKEAQGFSTGDTQTFEEVTAKDISNSIAVTGSIASNETRTLSTLVANTEVEEVFVEVGDYVNEGDPICTFDTSSIESNIAKLERQIQVNNAKATLELAKANTQVAWAWEDYYDNQADGEYDLNSAMINYQMQQNSVADAIATLEDRERALDDAKDDYHDYKRAKRNGTLSENSKFANSSKSGSDYREDIRDAEDAVANASRALQNAELSLENTVNSYNKTVEELQDKGRTDLRTISTNMASVIETQLNNMTTNDDAEEKIRDYETSLDNCKITAPISGVVTSVSVVVGDEYNEKSTICVIQDDSSYKVSGTVDQYDVAEISESMNCVIKTDATGDDQMTGILTFVSPVPESSSSSASSSGSGSSSSSSSSSTEYPIEITIEGRDDRLRIGMTAEASILIESREGVKAVPYDAIEEDSEGNSYVNIAVNAAEAAEITAENTGNAGSIDADAFDSGNGEAGGRGQHGGGRPGAAERKYSENPLADFIASKIMGKSAAEYYMANAETATKRVQVEKGLETDYYTEIISDEVEIGDEVLIPNSISSSDDSSSSGGMMGGGGGRGGGPGGGGPGGGF